MKAFNEILKETEDVSKQHLELSVKINDVVGKVKTIVKDVTGERKKVTFLFSSLLFFSSDPSWFCS